MIKHVHRKEERSPEQAKKLRSDRQRYQQDKPSPEQLLAEGGHSDFIPLGELMLLRQITTELKRERERQGLTLADVSASAGIDQAALSRLETGANHNPTLETLFRIAAALGKVIRCVLQDAPAEPEKKQRLAKA